MKSYITDRRFRAPRLWSNEILAAVAPAFSGEIVNVSAWDDRDKEGKQYKEYFSNASGYFYTNYGGERGSQGLENEFYLDLTGELPDDMVGRFDVVFNHTTLEHIFEVRKAFRNLCDMTRDIVIVVVPFAQAQHETSSWKDYWRFTPTCLREMFKENGLTPIFEAESKQRNAGVYLLMIGARTPTRWVGRLPQYQAITEAAGWIGERNILVRKAARLARKLRIIS